MKNTIDLFRLDGRIALVTGGSGNVGRPIVRALAEAGATVLLASRIEANCKAYAAELAGEGLQVEGERCDLASESEIRALRDRILERHGRLDVLFNNSLVRAGGDLRHTSAAEWEASMRVNSTGLFSWAPDFFRTDARAAVGIDRKYRLDLRHGGAGFFPL